MEKYKLQTLDLNGGINMAIYVWLEYTKIMQVYDTHEDLHNMISGLLISVKQTVWNQDGIKVMIERNTNYWR